MTFKNKKCLKYVLIIFIFIFCFLITNAALAASFADDPNVELQVPLFGYKTAQNIAEYIKTIFIYVLYIIVPIAVLIIMYSGVIWIFAAGNTGKIKDAKKRITSAVLGLLIAALSYIILSLVGLGELKLPGIEKIDPYDIPDFELMDLTNMPVDNGAQAGACDVPVYRQGGDKQTGTRGAWADKTYGRSGCSTFAKGGCGPTSLAMVLSFYGLKKDPGQAGNEILAPNGCRPCGGVPGTSRGCFGANSKALSSVGFKGLEIPQNKVLDYLKKGIPLVAHVGTPCKFTHGGHYIVLDCYKDGKIMVNDPNGNHPSPWPSTEQEVFGCADKNFWYIAPAAKFQPL